MNIIWGLIMIIVGALIVIKSEAILSALGRLAFFEKYLGTEGGSRLGYKLVGLATVFIGALIMTGLIQDFMLWVFSPLINISTPTQITK